VDEDPDDVELSVGSAVDDHELLAVRRFDSHMGPVPQPGPYVALVGRSQDGAPPAQLTAWATIGLLFGALTERALRAPKAHPASPEPTTAPVLGRR